MSLIPVVSTRILERTTTGLKCSNRNDCFSAHGRFHKVGQPARGQRQIEVSLGTVLGYPVERTPDVALRARAIFNN